MTVRWPVFSLKKLERLIRAKTPTPWGASCTYIRWTKTVGLKMYSERRERTTCWGRQRKAHKIGAAPEAGVRFSFTMMSLNGDRWESDAPPIGLIQIHCYWTEHAERVRHAAFLEREALKVELRNIGLRHSDLWEKNLGKLKGKLVCIDFDTASCDSTPVPKRKKKKGAA